MEITWLKDFAARWLKAEEQRRLPHAVLIAGPPGVGKRAAAAWMVGRKLSASGELVPGYPYERPLHPDLHWLERLEDKTSLLIDQVRELVHDLALTSHSGRGKAAVIDEAQLLTRQAANSLLKTLEEPRGDTLLVLVTDRKGELPATIFSRCQRIEIRVPPERSAIEWLDGLRPGKPWAEALRRAGHAPIAAIKALERLDSAETLKSDLSAIAAGTVSPVEAAERWVKSDAAFALDWLAEEVQQLARNRVGGAPSGSIPANSVLQRMDTRNVFCYLDQINRLRSRPEGTFNAQVALEGLLIDWACGLETVNRDGAPPAMMLARSRPGAE